VSRIVSGDLIEQLADAEHASWARWMAYLFSKCEPELEEGAQKRAVPTGALVIPAALVKHWQRQIDTPYADLSEREKQSDRDEVAQIVPAIKQHVTLALLEPAPDPNLSMGGYVCKVCGWDAAPDVPEAHRQDCPLWEDVS
jgi:hypothetical protein